MGEGTGVPVAAEMAVGETVGVAEGDGRGVNVGVGVGDAVGEGIAVGGIVGVAVGASVAVAVGFGMGVEVGSARTVAWTRACTVDSTSGVGSGCSPQATTSNTRVKAANIFKGLSSEFPGSSRACSRMRHLGIPPTIWPSVDVVKCHMDCSNSSKLAFAFHRSAGVAQSAMVD